MTKTVRKSKKMTNDWSNVIAHNGCEYDLIKDKNKWLLFLSFDMSFIAEFTNKKTAYKYLSDLA